MFGSIRGGIELANKLWDGIARLVTGRNRKKAREASEEDNAEIRKAAREGDVDTLNEKLGHGDD